MMPFVSHLEQFFVRAYEAQMIARMIEQMEAARDAHDPGELRSAYNAVLDRLRVLDSKLQHGR